MDGIPGPDEARVRRRRVGRTIGIIGGGACAVGVLALGVFPTRDFLEQRADLGSTQEQLSVLREQNEALEERIEALSTPEEIERLAREQYNLVHPGEEAYSVLPAPLPPVALPSVWPFGPLAGTADEASTDQQ
ncbi:MAG TPA: septum formation initiator family protein [Acidimicrobiales bacterium]|nr:septum formation initiator family protein [Acidimicrobiales bacterium]